jgi:hypothetical protein
VTLHEFLASLRDICLFRRGPEDMPYLPPLLAVLLVACGVLQAGFDLHNGAQPGVVAAALLGGLVVMAVVFLLLRGRGKPERFVQTMTALTAVYVLFDAVVFPLTLLIPLKKIFAHPTQPLALSGGQTLAMLAIGALGIWQLCTWIGILRRALEIPLAGGVLVLILLACINLIVVALIANLVGAG